MARMDRDAIYNAIRDVYLLENPNCWCGYPATEVHHIVRGTAGRSRALLNTNTFLGVCGDCHGRIEKMPWVDQVAIKQATIIQTVERLRN
jgi:cytochrome c553